MKKRGVWVGGLLLSLGAWVAPAGAQVTAQVSTDRRPAPAHLAPGDLKPVPAASLGRPVALGASGTAEPVTLGAIVPVAYQPLPLPLDTSAGPDRQIVAAAHQQTAPEGDTAAAEEVSSFATERGPGGRPVYRPETPGKVVQVRGDVLTEPFDPHLPPGVFYDDYKGPEDPDPFKPPFYFRGEYLLWWTRTDHTPPLVTTSAPADFGILGRPSTVQVFGGSLDGDPRSGARFTLGYWLDMWGEDAIELSGFFLAERTTRFNLSSTTSPVIARPFFNLNSNSEFSELVALPGATTGSIRVDAPSRLFGAEGNLKTKLCCGCDYRVDLFGGFRYLNLGESINITESIQGLPTAPPPFTNQNITVTDRFATANEFYGGQIGLHSEYHYGKWLLDVRGQVALGDTHQTIEINGGQAFQGSTGQVVVSRGGLLALPSNIGNFSRDRFTVVPEIGFNLGYQITDHWRVFVGYDFLYWSSVVRPGDQIDRVIDVTQIPNFPVPGATPTGQNRPTVPFKGTDFWAQGVNFGLEFRY